MAGLTVKKHRYYMWNGQTHKDRIFSMEKYHSGNHAFQTLQPILGREALYSKKHMDLFFRQYLCARSFPEVEM